jgi:hypothetical protein
MHPLPEDYLARCAGLLKAYGKFGQNVVICVPPVAVAKGVFCVSYDSEGGPYPQYDRQGAHRRGLSFDYPTHVNILMHRGGNNR